VSLRKSVGVTTGRAQCAGNGDRDERGAQNRRTPPTVIRAGVLCVCLSVGLHMLYSKFDAHCRDRVARYYSY
jgi:hypothetical protein